MKRVAALIACIAVVAAPSTALAQNSSTCQAYNPQLCNVSSETGEATSGGTLPFTGLDLGLLVLGGAGLAVAGLAVRAALRRLD
jgi:hypothetical protein